MDNSAAGARIHFPPPLIYVLGLVIGIVAGHLLRLPGLGLGAPLRYVASALILLAGLTIDVAGARLFVQRRTAILPFKPASCLVTSGVYRWTRNPMYLGFAINYVAISLITDSIAALLLLPVVIAVVQTQVIAREEAYLERAFGQQYRVYKSQVRRWI